MTDIWCTIKMAASHEGLRGCRRLRDAPVAIDEGLQEPNSAICKDRLALGPVACIGTSQRSQAAVDCSHVLC